VVKLVNSTGTDVSNYDYDIYGVEKEATEGTIKNPFRYSGEYYDEETGFYYLRARYYHPEIARFVSEDTYKGELTDPLTLNYYIYCAGNPIRYVDPTGNTFWDALDFVFAGMSWAEMINDPSWKNFGWAVVDTASLLPLVPSSGYFRQGSKVLVKLDDIPEGARVVGYVDNVAKGMSNLSNRKLEHVLKNHTAGRVQQTVAAMMKKGLTKSAEELVSSKNFFNTSWSEQKVMDATTKAYNEAIAKGIPSSGSYDYVTSVFGEKVILNFQDSIFKTAWGDYTLDLSDFGY